MLNWAKNFIQIKAEIFLWRPKRAKDGAFVLNKIKNGQNLGLIMNQQGLEINFKGPKVVFLD